jgi:hypothetical protein
LFDQGGFYLTFSPPPGFIQDLDEIQTLEGARGRLPRKRAAPGPGISLAVPEENLSIP